MMKDVLRMIGAGIAGAISLAVLIGCLLLLGWILPRDTRTECSALPSEPLGVDLWRPVIAPYDGTLVTTSNTQVTIYPGVGSLNLPDGGQWTTFTLEQVQDALHLQRKQHLSCPEVGECDSSWVRK